MVPAQSARAGGFPTDQNDGSAPDKNHCDKTAVGEAVSQTPNAVPARDDLIAPLSYLIALKVGKNRYATLREEFRQEFDVGQNKCPASNEIGDGEEYQIDLLRLALPIVFTLLFSGAGVAWYFLDKAGKCVTGAKDDDVDDASMR